MKKIVYIAAALLAAALILTACGSVQTGNRVVGGQDVQTFTNPTSDNSDRPTRKGRGHEVDHIRLWLIAQATTDRGRAEIWCMPLVQRQQISIT